jgi:hypothetical protein
LYSAALSPCAVVGEQEILTTFGVLLGAGVGVAAIGLVEGFGAANAIFEIKPLNKMDAVITAPIF